MLGQVVAYLLWLEKRTEERNFPPDDRLFVLVKRTHNALHDLFVETHELGCKVVGRQVDQNVSGHRLRRRAAP